MHPLLIRPAALKTDQVLQQLKETQAGMLIVVDEQRKLLGVLTQRGVHQALLDGKKSLHDLIEHPDSQWGTRQRGGEASTFPKRYGRFLPVVNEDNQVEEVLELPPHQRLQKDNAVVIMAGGMGKRLGELTQDLPKPMLPLGHQPLLHFILDSLIAHGFAKFYFCIHYKSEVIKSYFGGGESWGVDIRYIEEEKPLGTAGALSLIEEPLSHPLLVMNGDLITSLNFDSLLDFHVEKEALATMCLAEHNVQLPFGVVHTRNSRILSLEEKPHHKHFVNAGIYVLAP
ncbi:MAG: nucleotidyltransferase family protein, partial [Bacteroidota bacterium]